MATNTNFKVKNGLDVNGPITTTSNTLVTNLNADLLDGQQGSYYASISSPTFTGTPSAPTPIANTNTTQIATTEFVQSIVGNIETLLAAL